MHNVKVLIFSTLSIMSLLGFLALEMFARYLDRVPFLSTTNFVVEEQKRGMNFAVNRFDDRLGWVLSDNYGSGGFRTREHGIRVNVDDNSALAPLEENAIVAVGDSFAAGSEVTNFHTWPAYIERALNIPVYNGGTGAYAVDQIFERAKQLADVTSPKLIILGILTDDILRNTYSTYGGGHKPYYQVNNDGTYTLTGIPVKPPKKSEPNNQTTRSILGHSYLIYFVMRYFDKLHLWVSTDQRYKRYTEKENGAKITCHILKSAQEFGAQRNIHFVFFPQYGGNEALLPQPFAHSQAALKCANDIGISYVDPWNALKNTLENGGINAFKELYVMHSDNTVYGHMSNKGNELMASLLVKHLKSNFPDILRKDTLD